MLSDVVTERPRVFADPTACVDEVLDRVGPCIVLATPLGLGKPNQLLNAFYRRATNDPTINLRIITALPLVDPSAKGDLERRFLAPLVERVFGGYPPLEFAVDAFANRLPPNVEFTSFYLQPGSALAHPQIQQSYTSTNYTHVVRDVLAAGVNVLAQLVTVPPPDEQSLARGFSLSSNPDLSLDLIPRMRQRERDGHPIAIAGQVNRRLPYMYGDADVDRATFDVIVDDRALDFPLFGPPNPEVPLPDHAIGLYASALVRDGGTLQLGIGSLADAVCSALMLRHADPRRYRTLLRGFGADPHFSDVIGRIGGREPFTVGLYAATEMLVDGFLTLWRAGILTRRVYAHAGIQRLVNDGVLDDEVSLDTLDTLVEAGVVQATLGAPDVALLREIGVLQPRTRLVADRLELEGQTVPADLRRPEAHQRITAFLGARLRGGHIAHAGFFLGPRRFYQALRDLSPEERQLISMTRISFVNELYGDEELKRLQRRHARFLNSGMMATLLGAVVSDGLEDGRVVSGVGGQYNFVAMAHALDDGRSIIMIRSTRQSKGKTVSNILWNYGHVTIPRHLRDIVVTEYGVADLRGLSDEQVAARMLNIADSRFQEELLDDAKRNGKISPDYQIPERFRTNRPERIEDELGPFHRDGTLVEFPFGTDLTSEELILGRALRRLRAELSWDLSIPRLSEIRKTLSPPAGASPYLRRMGLETPRSVEEHIMQRAVVFALSAIDAI